MGDLTNYRATPLAYLERILFPRVLSLYSYFTWQAHWLLALDINLGQIQCKDSYRIL